MSGGLELCKQGAALWRALDELEENQSGKRECGGCCYFVPGGFDPWSGGFNAPWCSHPDPKVKARANLRSFPFKRMCPNGKPYSVVRKEEPI